MPKTAASGRLQRLTIRTSLIAVGGSLIAIRTSLSGAADPHEAADYDHSAGDRELRRGKHWDSWRARRAARRRIRLVSARQCRALAQGLRAIAKAAANQTPPRTWTVLLRSRAAPLQAELREVAALLERAVDPDPDCVAVLRDLLRDGVKSPLYNPAVEAHALAATLSYARDSLETQETAAHRLVDNDSHLGCVHHFW